MLSRLPTELKLLILSELEHPDLAMLARTCKALRDPAQNLLFSSFIVINGKQSDDHMDQTSLKSLCSLLFALLTNPHLRDQVEYMKLIFGCYCCDEDDDIDCEQFESPEELVRLGEVRDLWLHLDPVEKRQLRPVEHIFNRFMDGLSNGLEPHVWYNRCILLALCFVPNLSCLAIMTREWGRLNPHGTAAEAELRAIAEFIVQHKRLPRLEIFELTTWAYGVEWITDPHHFGALVTLPTLENIQADDVLLATLPQSPIACTELKITAPFNATDNRGNWAGRVVTEQQVLNYLQYTRSVRSLTIYPRETVHTFLGGPFILGPLGRTLTRLSLMRSLWVTSLSTTHLSSLVNLETLEINWHYITRSAFNRAATSFTNFDLGSQLPSSLRSLLIMNEGRPNDLRVYWVIGPHSRECITLQLLALLKERSTTHYTAPLDIEIDVYEAYRGDFWRDDLQGGYVRCEDWKDYILWRRDMTYRLEKIDEDEWVSWARGGVKVLRELKWRYEEWELEEVTTGWSWAPGVESRPVWQDYWIG